MNAFSLFSLLLLLDVCQAGTFTDDLGVTHEFTGKPTIATRAGVGAVSLYRLGKFITRLLPAPLSHTSFQGMRQDQIIAVHGTWGIRGSDLDPNNPEAPSIFPDSDPTPEEISFLSTTVNLSPDCYTDNIRCFDLDAALLETNKPDFFVEIGDGFVLNNIPNFNQMGIPVVFIDLYYESSPACRDDDYEVQKGSCIARSSIDIAERIHELAIAMNVDIPASVEQDRRELCDTAADFSNAMEFAHSRGIRVLPVTLQLFSGVVYLRPSEAEVDCRLRTMEELGMPLLHSTGVSGERMTLDDWFVDCPAGAIEPNCAINTRIPADFMLFDSRGYQYAVTDEFTEAFPDQIYTGDDPQFWYYARNDGALTYRSITRFLETMASKMRASTRLHPATTCLNANPTSRAFLNGANGGADTGEYVCYNEDYLQTKYTTCPELENTSDAASLTSWVYYVVVGLLASVLCMH